MKHENNVFQQKFSEELNKKFHEQKEEIRGISNQLTEKIGGNSPI